MKPKYYANIAGQRVHYSFPPINTYFAYGDGLYPCGVPAGAAFVHNIHGLIPLYRIDGQRYCRPEYAGKDLRELESFRP